MNLSKTFFIFVFLLFSASTSIAQEPKCSLKLAQLPDAPELRGFHLGMSVDEARRRVPTLILGAVDEFGLASTSVSPDFDNKLDKESFDAVRTVSLDFLDGRLTDLWIGYHGSEKWKNLDDFVSIVNRSLGFPNIWQTNSHGRQLACEDFQASVQMIGGGPSLRISDSAARQTWEERRTEKEDMEEQQPEEKPAETKKPTQY
ncbi:MAG: hypothetical protein WCB68_21465 [Pyrinomonadaceae bacterium]